MAASSASLRSRSIFAGAPLASSSLIDATKPQVVAAQQPTPR